MALLAGLVLLFGLGPCSLVSAQVVVTVPVGASSVTLPYNSLPLSSVPSVSWTRESDEVHLKVSQGDDFRKQAPRFKGRTHMKPDALQTGDMGLTLDRPNMTDAGLFTCVTKEGSTEVARVTVELKVTAPPPPVESSNVGLIVGLIVSNVSLVALVVIGGMTMKRHKQTQESWKDAFIGIITCRKPTSGVC